ncbi:hypothetical protein EDC94DRAFT_590151 [Helicostylum pulchrum]|nr:hypothetical protein EDC94DRAFT_590151 [Helicostylum pulchrum]
MPPQTRKKRDCPYGMLLLYKLHKRNLTFLFKDSCSWLEENHTTNNGVPKFFVQGGYTYDIYSVEEALQSSNKAFSEWAQNIKNNKYSPIRNDLLCLDGLRKSVGTIIKDHASTSNIIDYKTNYFKTLAMNNIVDISDLSAVSHLDLFTAAHQTLIVESLSSNHRQQSTCDTMEFDRIIDKYSSLEDDNQLLRKCIKGIEHENNGDKNKGIYLQIYLYNHEEDNSEADYVNKLYSSTMEVCFTHFLHFHLDKLLFLLYLVLLKKTNNCDMKIPSMIISRLEGEMLIIRLIDKSWFVLEKVTDVDTPSNVELVKNGAIKNYVNKLHYFKSTKAISKEDKKAWSDFQQKSIWFSDFADSDLSDEE